MNWSGAEDSEVLGSSFLLEPLQRSGKRFHFAFTSLEILLAMVMGPWI